MAYNFYNVFVKRVIDGDSFKVTFEGLPKLFGEDITIRLKGVNCPELRSSDREERHLAVLAKDFSSRWLHRSGFVDLLNCERGKYFRILAEVKRGDEYLAGMLIKSGHGVPSKL